MKAKILYDRRFAVGTISGRMAGSFAEHLNRCVYGGLYEPDHPQADSNGFRSDVKRAVRDAGVQFMRYPGGNFVSAYHWKDGIGPRDKRPRRFETAWQTVETNEVGTDEFARYLRELDIELMMCVNMGTGTPEEAAELVEYCNLPGGTALSDLRRANGSESPYRVKLWCVGNEMDGPWQIGQLSAEDYAKKFVQAARMMRRVDPSIQLIAAGSCSNEPAHRSYGYWDRTLLEAAYEEMDYLSLHRYYGYDVEQKLLYPRVETFCDIAYMAVDLEEMIGAAEGAIRHVKGCLRSGHEVYLSLDELSILPHQTTLPGGEPADAYRQIDAVLYGGLLCTLLNHADRVKLNAQSLIVNENGLYTTIPMGGVIPQSILYPFRDIARYAHGMALRPACELPEVRTEHYGPRPCVQTACAYNAEHGELNVFIANCCVEKDVEVQLCLNGFASLRPLEHIELYSKSPLLANTIQNPNAVAPVVRMVPVPVAGEYPLTVQKHSWNVFRFAADIN